MIIWTEQHETGSAKLDQQHRLLIDHINLLETDLQNPNPTREDWEFANHLVDFLEAYANIHLKGEETCMETYQCPVHAENQQAHECFRDSIRICKRQRELEGFNRQLLRNLHEQLRTWIVEHIGKIDTRLKTCIQANKV